MPRQVEEPHVGGAPISGSALLELVLPRTRVRARLEWEVKGTIPEEAGRGCSGREVEMSDEVRAQRRRAWGNLCG